MLIKGDDVTRRAKRFIELYGLAWAARVYKGAYIVVTWKVEIKAVKEREKILAATARPASR